MTERAGIPATLSNRSRRCSSSTTRPESGRTSVSRDRHHPWTRIQGHAQPGPPWAASVVRGACGASRPMAATTARRAPLATRAKGIYKPDGWDYALSIKILPDSPYDDGHPVPTPGGGWLLSYHQEGNNPDFYTNAALKRCIQGRIPVGVIRKIDARRRQVQYEVLGLARPVRWYGGYFILESVNPPATTQVDPLTDVLAADTEAERAQPDDVPPDDYDARRRTQRQITQRRGQPQFRAALIHAYGGRCAITRSDAVEALEAAHIQAYRGPASNVVSNGLPLRSDIHTLYDLELIAIDPDTREVVLSPRLYGTQYASLAGVRLLDPRHDTQRPNRRVLQSRWDDFHAALRTTSVVSMTDTNAGSVEDG